MARQEPAEIIFSPSGSGWFPVRFIDAIRWGERFNFMSTFRTTQKDIIEAILQWKASAEMAVTKTERNLASRAVAALTKELKQRKPKTPVL